MGKKQQTLKIKKQNKEKSNTEHVKEKTIILIIDARQVYDCSKLINYDGKIAQMVEQAPWKKKALSSKPVKGEVFLLREKQFWQDPRQNLSLKG